MPSEMDVVLKYVDIGNITGGGTQVSRRWNPNSIFALDPTKSSPAVGFAAWNPFYGFYRVIEYAYTISVVNRQTTPVLATVLNGNNDPGTAFNFFVAGNPMSQQKLLSPSGGLDKATFHGTVRVADVVGTNSIEYSDSYRALNNASPADVVWLSLGACDITGASLTVGVGWTITISSYTRLYDRLQL
jgi:hypothetical protein